MSRVVALREEALWTAVLALLLVVSVANNTAVGWLGPVGEMAIGAILSVGVLLSTVYLAAKGSIPRFAGGLLVGVLYIDAVYVTSLVIHGDPAGLKTVAGTVGVLSLFVAVVLFRWTAAGLKVFSAIIGIFVVASGMIGAVEFSRGVERVSGVFSNPNALAIFMLMAFYTFSLARLRSASAIERTGLVVGSVITLFLLVATGTRSAWLALLASGATYWIWPKLSRSRVRHHAFILFFFLGLAATVGLVVAVPTLEVGQTLNRLTETYTGRQLSTGREIIWLDVLGEISERPVLGHGPQVTTRGFGDLALGSAHNLYLQIAVQVGAVGLAGLIALMWWIWAALGAVEAGRMARTTGAILIGVLVQQSFEVSLTQNNLTLGLLAWLIIGLGVSMSLNEVRPET